jgi:membrane-associated phospholipid phosphatase
LTTAVAAAGRRYLPRGWADFARQVSIWFGFIFAYQIARGVADRDPAKAFANSLRVVSFEQRWTHQLVELTFQRVVDSSRLLATIAAWTYWNSEFTVVSLALLWVYLRRHDGFARFRNAILLANVIGLVGYVLLPTAPPRLVPSLGFPPVPHHNGLVVLLANPYAAMPSLHAADALIVGICLAVLVRRWWVRLLWLMWPLWVWFCVVATGNHFWLDVLAGNLVAIVALAVVFHRSIARLLSSSYSKLAI